MSSPLARREVCSPVDFETLYEDMAWATPQYSREAVDAAGETLRTGPIWFDEIEHTARVINNWRSSHSFPLNTMQMGLRHHAREIGGDSLVAQRIKRLSSIETKLNRFRWLTLSKMQDIGGCRAVVASAPKARGLARSFRESRIKHRLVDSDDYIQEPKRSGYRGVHLIYQYHSDRKDTYNGLKIEMQFRSTYQHAWATAVETVGTFIRQALKSSQGEADWLRFFALMGTALALREKTPPVPNTPTTQTALRKELREYTKLLDVEARLTAFGNALSILEEADIQSYYFLVVLDPSSQRTRIYGYEMGELEEASEEYLRVERETRRRGGDAVLVNVESVASLRRAYPNYFLDTRVFLRAVRYALGLRPLRRLR